jgi:hypothetical protein
MAGRPHHGAARSRIRGVAETLISENLNPDARFAAGSPPHSFFEGVSSKLVRKVSSLKHAMATEHDRSQALVAIETKGEIVAAAGAPALFGKIRPEWRAKGLIRRTTRLLEVDPSSACQRLFNAAVVDLRQKVIVAGLDIAKEAAARFKLPSITKEEDISENYTVARIIDLAYRIGILGRPE